jgi:hypothetical protein
MLSKTQRNALFDAIAQSPLPISECDFFNEKIRHGASESEFHIYDDRKGGFYAVWANVGDELTTGQGQEIGSFDEVLGALTDWANDVAQWIDTPDLWELNSATAEVPGVLVPESANTMFTPDEQAAISGQLKAIAEAVKKDYDLTAEQSARLDEKFEEAEKASRRMGRKDWGLLFGGAVFSLILADIITPGVAGHILMMIEHGLGHLFDRPPAGGILSAG